MLIKTGDAKVLKVINDDEHELDDEETRESINKAAKETVKKLVSGAKKEVESLAAKLSAN